MIENGGWRHEIGREKCGFARPDTKVAQARFAPEFEYIVRRCMMDIKLLGFNMMLVGVFVLIAKWPTKQYKKLLAEYLEAKKNGIDLSPMKSPWQDPYKHTGLINAWTKYRTRRIAILLVGLGVLLFFIGSF